jgi:hypothetical protein
MTTPYREFDTSKYIEEFMEKYGVEPAYQDVVKAALTAAQEEIERYRIANETDAKSLRETVKENVAMREKVVRLEKEIEQLRKVVWVMEGSLINIVNGNQSGLRLGQQALQISKEIMESK